MATRGRKQKECFLKYNLGEMLEKHLAGKTTKKRQNSNSSTPSASPFHIKWRNHEGSCDTRHQLLLAREKQTTR
jgi:hypothetical protein